MTATPALEGVHEVARDRIIRNDTPQAHADPQQGPDTVVAAIEDVIHESS